MRVREKNHVTEVPAVDSATAQRHFEAKAGFETDCWDVHSTQHLDDRGFILVDVRSPDAFAKGHLPGAINIPRASLTPTRLAEFDADALLVVYCSGPHCNGSSKAAAQLARLGRPVKEMLGGTTGWCDEGFSLVRAD